DRFRRTPLQSCMGAVTVVVALERQELHLQIGSRPEQGAVRTFPPNRADESFDVWMRERRVGHRLDFFHCEDAQVGLPLVEWVQPIMVRAEVRRWGVTTCRSVEHA